MIDIRNLTSNFEEVKKALETRGGDFSYLDQIIELDEQRRNIIVEVEKLKAKRNETSKMIGQYKREGKDVAEILASVENIGTEISEYDEKLKTIDSTIEKIILATPNIPNKDIVVGTDEKDNKELRKVGELPNFKFKPLAHWDVATSLDIIDFERAAKITGARFAVYKGLGARLERALISFMLDLHTQNGYTEILPPYIVNRTSMTCTGQLPKFEEDAFKLTNNENYFLIPTAEVPVTNLHRDEIIDEDNLPIKYTAYSACFRAEAGSAGRDTRGIIRQHQFNKVELVKFVTQEESYNELEKLTNNAEEVLKQLGLPYRVIELCTGDIGFSAAKTYDIEVWLPSYNEYKEISSCSNFEDFQARRANIKYRKDKKEKAKLVHTLNGSGLAIGRTVAAILENNQQEDGSVKIPEVLRPYMNNFEYIK